LTEIESRSESQRIPTASGDALAATLYPPEGVEEAARCVVMGAGGTLTRRDGIPEYAERFAAAGVAALTFDYRHWGDSDGEPRRLASVPRQLEDWRAAVEFARGLPGIDPDRIAVWGMSLGGGHALSTAAADPRIAAVITLVPMADGLAFSLNTRVLRFTVRATTGRLRRRFVALPAVGPAAAFPADSLADFERLAGPNGWRNEIVTDLDYPLALYRPYRRAARIDAPVLVQLGEHDRLAPRRAVEGAAERAPHGELRRYPVDHFSCFWPERIDEVVGDQIAFLRDRLIHSAQ
jgi:dienelactone hydrolase